jgi:hypothetical protein
LRFKLLFHLNKISFPLDEEEMGDVAKQNEILIQENKINIINHEL